MTFSKSSDLYSIKNSNVFCASRTGVPISTDNKGQAKEELEKDIKNKIFKKRFFTLKL